MYQFKFEELIGMALKSAAMRSLENDELHSILEQSSNPASEKAQLLYAALINEQTEYERIRKDYIRTTDKIMIDLNNEVTGIKNSELHKEREKAEERAAKKEEEIAKDILQSLK